MTDLSRRGFLGGLLAVPVVAAAAPLDGLVAFAEPVANLNLAKLRATVEMLRLAKPNLILTKMGQAYVFPMSQQVEADILRFRRPLPFTAVPVESITDEAAVPPILTDYDPERVVGNNVIGEDGEIIGRIAAHG